MFIQTEDTPNPNSLKFILETQVSQNVGISFEKDAKDTYNDFAKSIFDIKNIVRVFLLDNFITITKTEDGDWNTIKPQVLSLIMDFISANKNFAEPKEVNKRNFETKIEEEIYQIIEDRVKPAVAIDGGDIEFVKFTEDDGVVYVSMHGSCSGCPSSGATLKDGIKRTLQYYVPEVMDVVQV